MIKDELNLIKLACWMNSDDYGLSSRTLITHLIVGECFTRYHPLDIADLKRCVRSIIELDFLTPKLEDAKKISKEWEYLINNWDKIKESKNNCKDEELKKIIEASIESGKWYND